MATSKISFTVGDDSQYGFSQLYPAGYTVAQTFTTGALGFTVSSIKVKLFRQATAGGTLTLELRNASTGDPYPPGDTVLSSGTLSRDAVTAVSPGEWYEFVMSAYTLAAETRYAIVLYNSTNVATYWRLDSADGYAAGFKFVREMSGPWTRHITHDMMFDIYSGDPDFPHIVGGNQMIDMSTLVEDTSPDTTNDFVVTWDANLQTYRKITLNRAGAAMTLRKDAAVDYSVTSFMRDGMWRDLDLSGILPAGATMFWGRVVIKTDVVGKVFGLRENGHSGVSDSHYAVTQTANQALYVDIGPVGVDSNRMCEYFLTTESSFTWVQADLVITAWR